MLYVRRTQELTIRHIAARLVGGSRSYGKENDSSDRKEENQPKLKEENAENHSPQNDTSNPVEESASVKLNRLLASMQTADSQLNSAKYSDIIVKPGLDKRMRMQQYKEEVESKDIFAAARKVASMLDGGKDQPQTESELLSRLLGGKFTENTSEQQKISNEGDISLSELIVGMKIDRHGKENEYSHTRSEYVRRNISANGKQRQEYRSEQKNNSGRLPMQRKRGAEIYTGSVNLSGGTPLGIFTDPVILKDSFDLLPTWSYLYEQALKVQVSHPPANYFEKLARWTEQGKVWRFPIDNEQDWTDEKDVDFTEHIFLEQHLEEWCPSRGPIRHFMELVCVGLSKNPFITAKEKKDHIMWYKNYFESKKDILKDYMSKDAKDSKNLSDRQERQIEA